MYGFKQYSLKQKMFIVFFDIEFCIVHQQLLQRNEESII